jgi:hypothetical protein
MTTITFTNEHGEQITIKIGDCVGFERDGDQYGKVIKISTGMWEGEYDLVVENTNGFRGEYIGGKTKTVVNAEYTWID